MPRGCAAARRMRKGANPQPKGGITDQLIIKNTPTDMRRGESRAKFIQRITHLNLMGKKITTIVRWHAMLAQLEDRGVWVVPPDVACCGLADEPVAVSCTSCAVLVRQWHH